MSVPAGETAAGVRADVPRWAGRGSAEYCYLLASFTTMVCLQNRVQCPFSPLIHDLKCSSVKIIV